MRNEHAEVVEALADLAARWQSKPEYSATIRRAIALLETHKALAAQLLAEREAPPC